MGKKARSLLNIASIYFGAVLGAGFASGGELLEFFGVFKNRGIIGVLVASALFSLLGKEILSKSFFLKEKTVQNYLETVFKKPLARFLSVVMTFFLAVTFCVMLSGSGAFFSQRFSLPIWVGVLLMDALCLLVFMFDLKGLSALSVAVTPLMFFGMIYVCLYGLFNESRAAFLPAVNHDGLFLPYAFFYVGYNMLTAAAVLVPTSALADNEKTAGRGGVLGGIMLGCTALLCVLVLVGHESLWLSPLPMLLLSAEAGEMAHILYSLVLFCAMLTTAVSAGFSLIADLSRIGGKGAAVTVCLAALPLSFVPFSLLVRYLYPAFGILGLILIFGILWNRYQKR